MLLHCLCSGMLIGILSAYLSSELYGVQDILDKFGTC